MALSIQVVVQAYNELHGSLSDIDRMLLQHQLQQIEKVLKNRMRAHTCRTTSLLTVL